MTETLGIPLTVRIVSETGDRHVTLELAQPPSFGKAVPGGYTYCRLSLARPIDVMQTDLTAFARVVIYDGRTAETVWEGDLEDPGRSASSSGQVWSLQAIGGAGHARNREVDLGYVWQDWDGWERYAAGSTRKVFTADVTDDPGGADRQALVLAFPPGTALAGQKVSARWVKTQYGSQQQQLARIAWTRDTAQANASYRVRVVIGYGGTMVSDTASSLSQVGGSARVGVDWVRGPLVPQFVWEWTGAAATSGTDDTWLAVVDIVVQTVRYLKTGAVKETGYDLNTILASDVVADLLGRLLAQYDGANAVVEATTFGIDQFAYDTPATPADMLEDLMLLEPSFYWAAWERNPETGKYRFEWRSWPTTVRYEATVDDGLDAPQSAADVYNRVSVSWLDARGHPRVTVRTQSVPMLDSRQIVREKAIDLGSAIGSTSQAGQVGDGFLADHRFPANRGTLTVARKIKDFATGRIVDPWEIMPGHLIRVNGVESYPDALNANSRDGLTVFRIMETDYDGGSNEARLALDAPARSGSRALATVLRRAEAKGRR